MFYTIFGLIIAIFFAITAFTVALPVIGSFLAIGIQFWPIIAIILAIKLYSEIFRNKSESK